MTVGDEQLRVFLQGLRYNFPAALGKPYLSRISINKLDSKYVILSDRSCGVVFDRRRFLTDPASLADVTPPDYVALDGDKYRVNFENLDKIVDEDGSLLVFYDGNYDNYFHWWAECLVNLQLAEVCLGVIPPVVIWNGKPALNAWRRASLDLLGVDVVHRTTPCSQVVRVKEAMWFYRETGYVPGSLLRGLRAKVLGAISAPTVVGKKIFIKRKTHRHIKNEIDVECMLAEQGFESICTEDFSQIDQIKLFSAAKVVVATHGAGLTNMLFMPPGATVIELMPHVEARPFFWLMAEKLQHRYGVLMCNAVDGGFNGAIEVELSDLGRLIAMMDAAKV